MKALKLRAKTDDSGVAHVEIPTDINNTYIELIVVVETKHRFENLEKKSTNYDFSDFVGKMQWDIDPVSYQRKLREEW